MKHGEANGRAFVWHRVGGSKKVYQPALPGDRDPSARSALRDVMSDMERASELDVIVNPISGQRVRFLSVTTEILHTGFEVQAGHVSDPRHIHPQQVESITVVGGHIRASLSDGSTHVLGPGQSWEILPGTPHTWTAIDSHVDLLIDFRPALRTRRLLTRLFGLAEAGKTNSKGLPNPFQLAVVAREYQSELRLANPPWIVQKLLFSALAPLASRIGYTA
jgi:quercetin dioxygenase-like cupin family protein